MIKNNFFLSVVRYKLTKESYKVKLQDIKSELRDTI